MSFLLVFRRYAPFNKFGFGFEGDHRSGPSVSMHATARTIGIVPFANGKIGSIKGESSGTQYMGGGDWLRQVLGRHWSSVVSTVTRQHASMNSIRFSASTAGANPMLKGAPDIDTYVDFNATWQGSGVRLNGAIRGDNFPNAEVFVIDAKGTGCLLFDGRTTGGQNTGPMTRLAGAHNSQLLGQFSCAMPLSPAGLFIHAKNSGVITKMEASKAAPQWKGAGGSFNGAGATGRW
jgi:hypothetical protein